MKDIYDMQKIAVREIFMGKWINGFRARMVRRRYTHLLQHKTEGYRQMDSWLYDYRGVHSYG